MFDPREQRPLTAHDAVVRCAACGAFQLRSSWRHQRRCVACQHDTAWEPGQEPFAFTAAEFAQVFPPQPPKRRIRVQPPASAGNPQADASAATRQADRSRIVGLGWQGDRLDAARVLVVGAGAIGNELLKNLALVGVGHLLIVDMDHIEASNLTRSVLFRPEDVGQPKAEVAARRLQELEGRLCVQALNAPLTDAVGPGLLRRFDAVAACVDNRQARIDLARYCAATRTPMLEGGVDHLSGAASLTFPPETACYDCQLTDAARAAAQNRTSCPGVVLGQPHRPSVPFTPSISSLVAAVMSQWLLLVLHDQVQPRHARQFLFHQRWLGDRLQESTDLLSLDIAPSCPTHNRCRHTDASYQAVVDEPIRTGFGLDQAANELLHATDDALLQEPRELRLGYDFAPFGFCFRCGRQVAINARYGEIQTHQIRCPAGCRDAHDLPMTVQPVFVGDPEAGWLTADNPLTQRPLRDLAVRAFDFVHVRGLSSGQSVTFEIASDADAARVLGPLRGSSL